LACSATANDFKPSFASERMQAAQRSQLRRLLSSNDFNHRCRSPFRSLPSRLICRTLTQMRCRTVAIHCRWYRSLWATTTLAVESPTDLFVASHWLERSSSRFPVTLLEFSRADHSTSQVLTTSYVVLSQLFTEGLLQKPPSKSDLRWLVSRPWRHTPRLLVMHVVFWSLLKIFEYATKQCNQLQCNNVKLLEPVSINGLHNIRSTLEPAY